MPTTPAPARARSRRLRPLALLATAVALVLSLSGCVKLHMDLSFHADDTVDGTVILAVSRSLLESTGASIDDVLGEEDPFGNEAASSKPYEDDDYVGKTYTLVDQSLEDFGDEDMSVTHEDGKFVVDGTLDLSSGEDTPGLSGGDIRIAFTFPGKIQSANGEIDGSTVTWTGEAGDVIDMQAVASDEGGSGSAVTMLVWVLVGLVVLALVAVIAVVLVRRRNAGAAAVEPGAEGAYGAVPAAGYGYGTAPDAPAAPPAPPQDPTTPAGPPQG